MKKIITVKRVLLLILLVVSNVFSQSIVQTDSAKQIAVEAFANSSHHWYDITAEDNVINPLPGKPKYKRSEIDRIADNVLLYQKSNGGWPKNYDMLAILTDDQRDELIKSKNILNTTFDNWTTHSHVEYLARVFEKTNDVKYRDAALKGIDFILSAQYRNGGWPQYFPDTIGYPRHITFNDGVIVGIMKVLKNIIDGKSYYSFVDDARRTKVNEAYQKGLDCILKCQINENGVFLAWCQQHDHFTLEPQWARKFEPPSICNGESSAIVLFLMSIEKPSKEIINSINSAVKWFERSKILETRVQVIEAQKEVFQFRASHTDRIVVHDPKAPPIWTRYYELKTHKPLFCNRDSKIVYSLAEVLRERRDGYSWYTYDPQEVLDKYSEWKMRVDAD
jgi:PelA/Pel-15E family pectate lyase